MTPGAAILRVINVAPSSVTYNSAPCAYIQVCNPRFWVVAAKPQTFVLALWGWVKEYPPYMLQLMSLQTQKRA